MNQKNNIIVLKNKRYLTLDDCSRIGDFVTNIFVASNELFQAGIDFVKKIKKEINKLK